MSCCARRGRLGVNDPRARGNYTASGEPAAAGEFMSELEAPTP